MACAVPPMSPGSGAVLRGAGGLTVRPRALLLLAILSAIGANPVPSDVIVPPVNAERRGLPARSTDRSVLTAICACLVCSGT